MLGLEIAGLLNGSIFVEALFSLPCVGRVLVDAVEGRDFPVLQFGLIAYALIVVLVSLLIGLAYVIADPRDEPVRAEGRRIYDGETEPGLKVVAEADEVVALGRLAAADLLGRGLAVAHGGMAVEVAAPEPAGAEKRIKHGDVLAVVCAIGSARSQSRRCVTERRWPRHEMTMLRNCLANPVIVRACPDGVT